jgi:hypothetical protein
MSLRVSAKDLIGNHLTMALYNHAAMYNARSLTHRRNLAHVDALCSWEAQGTAMLPRAYFLNGARAPQRCGPAPR